MIALQLAAYCLLAPLGFLSLVALAGFIGRKLDFSDFSWWRYGAWLASALALVVLVIAARTGGIFLLLAALLVVWVLARAAADAQSTTLLEKLGFLQLYGGLCLVEALTLSRIGALEGTRASPWLAYVLHDLLGHLVLPLSTPLGGVAAADVVFGVAQALSENWMFAVAMATFGASAFAYAHFAEHATPKVGLSLLPAPTLVAAIFVGAWCASVALAGSPLSDTARAAGIALSPFFVAEGLWVLHRLGRALTTRSAWTAALGVATLILPVVGVVLAVMGVAFHLVRLRAFQPILGDVLRSAGRPRLRTGVAVAGVGAVLCLVLGAAEAAWFRAASPHLLAAPSQCAEVNLAAVTEGAATVSVSAPGGAFHVDADETPLQEGVGAEAACAEKGARLCTSDEWALVCRCSFPNESEGGAKLTTNSRMLFRRDSERAHVTGPGSSPVRGLLTGALERVSAKLGGDGAALLAGAADGVDAPFSVDCRYRGLVTERALRENAFPFVAARCCR